MWELLTQFQPMNQGCNRAQSTEIQEHRVEKMQQHTVTFHYWVQAKQAPTVQKKHKRHSLFCFALFLKGA